MVGKSDLGQSQPFRCWATARGLTSYPHNPLAYDTRCPASTAYYPKPCGSWLLNDIYAVNGTNM